MSISAEFIAEIAYSYGWIMEDTMSKVVFGSLVMIGMVALPGPTAVTGGVSVEIAFNSFGNNYAVV